MHSSTALVLSLPWILPPAITWFRLRNSRSLDDESDSPPNEPPLVSVIVPARNEARNIGRCVASILNSSYPNIELIVVDDHSTDGTADVARSVGRGDQRLRILNNPGLPPDWFGKQWACATGAASARGDLFQFTDADTEHAPDLVTRSVNAIVRTHADMFSVAGKQKLGGFWERVIQPQVFTLLSMRYGGTESVNNSTHVADKIANGQCIFVRRASYEELGGHASVKTSVAEDLMLAQTFFAKGKHTVFMLGVNQLSTRMYASLREIVGGWQKNVFAGGMNSVPFGVAGRALFPIALLLPPVMALLPPIVLIIAVTGVAFAAFKTWAAICTAAMLIWWAVAYATIGESVIYAALFPLGAAVLLYIFIGAIVRGRRVTWKGRTYISR